MWCNKMTILDDAMRKHIEYIVCTERRPFSFVDFLTFEVDQQHHKMSHGTFRNKISAMLKREEVEVAYYSKQAFYTIKGVGFAKTMTPHHTGGTLSSTSICSPQELRHIKNHPVYRVIQNIPFENSALHDIRLRTTVNGIWRLLSPIPSLPMDANSKDIQVIKEEINHLNIRMTVHHSDTIGVVIGCSFSPVAVDIDGINRLSNALKLIHDRLQRLVNDKKDCDANCNDNSGPLIIIPNHMTWIVTMWHFGVDSSIEYTGERFSASWKVAQNALIAVYSKQWKDGKYRIRGERQEYPGKPLDEAFDEKLNLIGGRK
jgi:hypothetical protein